MTRAVSSWRAGQLVWVTHCVRWVGYVSVVNGVIVGHTSHSAVSFVICPLLDESLSMLHFCGVIEL